MSTGSAVRLHRPRTLLRAYLAPPEVLCNVIIPCVCGSIYIRSIIGLAMTVCWVPLLVNVNSATVFFYTSAAHRGQQRARACCKAFPDATRTSGTSRHARSRVTFLPQTWPTDIPLVIGLAHVVVLDICPSENFGPDGDKMRS